MSTLKEIAEKLGVSVSTVSYVYNGKWREKGIKESLAKKVKREIEKSNYRPNILGLQLKTKKTQTIGVILGDLTRNFNLNILSGIEKVMASYNYFTFVCNSSLGEKEKENLETLISRHVEGLILSPQNEKTFNLIKELIENGKRIVFVDNYIPEINSDFVVSDNFYGSYKGIEFLIKNGYRKIAYIGGKKNITALNDRFMGYISALKENGIEISEKLICRDIVKEEDIYFALERIFSYEKVDAIFAESLLYFKEGFRFLEKKKLKIPDDIGLIGFDPIDLSLKDMTKFNFHSIIKGNIPFVEQKGIEMGEMAAKILIEKIEGKDKKIHQIFLKPDLKFS